MTAAGEWVAGIIAVITGAIWVGRLHNKVVQLEGDRDLLFRLHESHLEDDKMMVKNIATMQADISNIKANIQHLLRVQELRLADDLSKKEISNVANTSETRRGGDK